MCWALHIKAYRNRRAYVAYQMDGLVQERRNYMANSLELRLSCINSVADKGLLPIRHYDLNQS